MSDTEHEPSRGPAQSPRQGVLLLNLGTPASPGVRDVRRFLREFLWDPRVIDLPALPRWLLLNLVVLPRRPRRAAAAYRQIWTERGSPLLVHGHDLADKVAKALGAPVELGMRYQQPSITAALGKLAALGLDRIVVLPLFPQYSGAAWASAVEKVYAEARKLTNLPPLSVVPPFYGEPAFLDALAAQTAPHLAAFRPDKILMSFHGLPVRHVQASDLSGGQHCLVRPDCCARMGPANHYCYRSHCFATARGLAQRLELGDDLYEVGFQSRMGRIPWIKPYTDQRLQQLPGEGARRVLVLCPSFVADCLETLEEIGIRGRQAFLAAGGEELQTLPCLNSTAAWVDGVTKLIGLA